MASGYYFDLSNSAGELPKIIDPVFGQVLRFDFNPPGFALVSFGTELGSSALRQCMVSLKRDLSARFQKVAGKPLIYLSMGRFDQQVTTKFHLDGAPDQSMLMLGYEPSNVRSRIFLADYSKCAHERGIDPKRYLDEHNPMFSAGAELLAPYTTEVVEFNAAHFQILLINNSSRSYSPEHNNLLGVMHKAEIVNPNKAKRRIVNSTMICAAETGMAEKLSLPEQEAYIQTKLISKANY